MTLNRDVEAAVCAQVFGKQAAAGLHLSMLDGLYNLVQTRPAAFAQVVSICDIEALKRGLQDHGVSIGRGSTVPYRVLMTALESTLAASPGASEGGAARALALGKSDHHRMLQALSRSPESQVVSPSLFVSLYAEWCRQGVSANANTAGTGGAASIPLLADREVHSQLMLALPDCMFLFDLIRTRLGVQLARIAQLSDRLTTRKLGCMLRDSSIVVKPHRWAAVLDVLKLPEYGVFVGASAGSSAGSSGSDSAASTVFNMGAALAPADDGASSGGEPEVIASALLRVCKACIQSNVLVLPGYQVAADVKDRKLYAGTLLRNMRAVWPAVQSVLQGFRRSGNVEVSAKHFFEAAASVGLRLSAEDCELAWALLQQKALSGSSGIAAGALDAIFRSDSTLALDTDANAASHMSMLTALTHRDDALDGPCETGKNGLYHQTQHRRHVSNSSHQASTVVGQYLEWKPDEYAHTDLVQYPFEDTVSHKYSARLYGDGHVNGLPWELQEGESFPVRADDGKDGGGDTPRSGIAPWMQQSRDENIAATNGMKHVIQRLHALPTPAFVAFVKMLDAAHMTAGNSGLTRHAIVNALGAAHIRVDQKQAALLYAGAASGGRVAVTCDSMFSWLDRAANAFDGASLGSKLASARVAKDAEPVREAMPAVQVNFSAAPADTLAPASRPAAGAAPTAAVPETHVQWNGSSGSASATAAAGSAGFSRSPADSVDAVISCSVPAPVSPLASPSRSEGGKWGFPRTPKADSTTNAMREQEGARSAHAAAQNRLKNDTSHIFNASMFSTEEDANEAGAGLEDDSFSSSTVHKDIFPGSVPVQMHATATPAAAAADISAAVVDVLQQKRAALALLFRRLTAANAGPAASTDGSVGAGLVTLRAFSETISSLVGGQLGARLASDPQVTHKIACDIINAPYTCDASVATVHYTDVICHLDAVLGEQQRGDMGSSILRRLKDKCHVATTLKGEKLRLLMLTPQLRQRLKQRFLAGKSLGYQGSGNRDQCSAQDLVDVFECIDLHLSPLEAKFLCTTTGDDALDGSRTALEAGTSLGAVVRYLSENVLV